MPLPSPTARELTRWLGLAAAGAVVLAAAYVVFINTNLGYEPAGEGENNRVNAAAVVGYCLIVYAVAMLAATLLTRRPGSPVTVALASLLTGLVAIGYADRSRSDVHSWDHAASLQHAEISRLGRLPKPAPGATAFYTLRRDRPGRRRRVRLCFEVTWDLDTAVELHWHDPTPPRLPDLHRDNVHLWPGEPLSGWPVRRRAGPGGELRQGGVLRLPHRAHPPDQQPSGLPERAKPVRAGGSELTNGPSAHGL